MRIARYIVAVLVLAGLSVGSYAFLNRGIKKPDAEVPVTEVAKGQFRVTVREVGFLKAKKTAAVTTQSQGKVTKMLREGSFVEKDEPFLWMETKEIEEQIKELEVSVEVADANLQKTRENNELQKELAVLTVEQSTKDLAHSKTLHEDALEEYAKTDRLVKNGLMAEKDLIMAESRVRAAKLNIDKAEISLEKAQRQLETNSKIWVAEEKNAEADYEQKNRQLEKAKQELKDTILKAPVSGIVVYERMWKGSGYEKVQEGDQVWQRQKVAEIPDMSTMTAMVQINEMDSSMVKEGQEAEIRLVAFPELLLKGTVTKKATLAEDKSRSRYFRGDRSSSAGLRTFDITVELEEVDPRLRQGMTSNVTIVVDIIPDATHVPLEAVFDGDTDEQKVVYVKNGDRFDKRTVDTGAANDNYVIVKSGIEAGEQVALKKPDLAS
jgi:RND family efflux transporter MFP subunit